MSNLPTLQLNRRRMLAAAASAAGACPWLPTLAADAARDRSRVRSCVLLWMNGGPSQTDTFDLKPDHANGGPFKPIATDVPGLTFCEHLPQTARWGKRLAVV